MNTIMSHVFLPKQKSKATQLLECLIADRSLPEQIVIRAHPFAKQIGNIPNEEIDKVAPRLMRLLHEWYGNDQVENPDKPDN